MAAVVDGLGQKQASYGFRSGTTIRMFLLMVMTRTNPIMPSGASGSKSLLGAFEIAICSTTQSD